MFKKAFVAFLLFLLMATPAIAAIAFDATANHQASNTGTSETWTHTTSTGSDRILIVGVTTRGDDGTAAPNGVTYDSVSMTKIRDDSYSVSNSSLWRLVAPATGSNAIVVSWTTNAVRLVAGSMSFTGVDQTNPIDSDNGATGSSTAPSVTLTTVAANAWGVDNLGIRTSSSETVTIDVGDTEVERWNLLQVANGLRGSGSHRGPLVTPGSLVMSWTISGSRPWGISAASLKPFVVAAPAAASGKPTVLRMLMKGGRL